MGAVIKRDAQLHYIVDLVSCPTTQIANLSEPECQIEGTSFALMADQDGQGEHKEQKPYFDYGELQHWDDHPRRRVSGDAHPVTEVQCLTWENWYTQLSSNLHDHDMNHYDAQLWAHMTQ